MHKTTIIDNRLYEYTRSPMIAARAERGRAQLFENDKEPTAMIEAIRKRKIIATIDWLCKTTSCRILLLQQ